VNQDAVAIVPSPAVTAGHLPAPQGILLRIDALLDVDRGRAVDDEAGLPPATSMLPCRITRSRS
jgi:hypothetical protein